MRWLLCFVGSTRVFVPTDAVKLIAEYVVGPPPPLTSPYVAGVGVMEGGLVLSVRVGFRPNARERRTKGILLSTAGSALDWAFEVDETVGLVAEEPKDMLQSEPPWLRRTRGGERVLDVASMVATIGGA
ncbi:MAG: hypothetical protein R3B48_12340 [Kofleriaceae bacterium]